MLSDRHDIWFQQRYVTERIHAYCTVEGYDISGKRTTDRDPKFHRTVSDEQQLLAKASSNNGGPILFSDVIFDACRGNFDAELYWSLLVAASASCLATARKATHILCMDYGRVSAVITKFAHIFPSFANLTSHTSWQDAVDIFNTELLIAPSGDLQNLYPQLHKIFEADQTPVRQYILPRREVDQCTNEVARVLPGLNHRHGLVGVYRVREHKGPIRLLYTTII